ncbi:MAG: NmrA family transcriptional regulator [Anaerolineales bacterium]|nr:SDR family oxidoreductase [Anaerolineae bacterium]PWB77900.1 MAG: NmrA family transcriptional regulator [Anaerolineales bacterium]
MRIIVFGASGGTGSKIVEQALENGHIVTAFVRSPSIMQVEHPNLKIVQGDVLDAEGVEKAIAGQEAVVSALGPTRPPVPHMMETAARNIVAGMKGHGVRRIVSTTGAGVRQPEDQPKFIDRFFGVLLSLLAKDVVLDSAANVEVIQESDLDWTIVRFPRLVDGERTGKHRVGYVGSDSGSRVSRADAAGFVLKELVDKKWLKRSPVVSY